MTIAPLVSAARGFLEKLFTGKPGDSYILIWTLHGEKKRSRWLREVQQAAAYVASLPQCNVYVGIGLSPSDFGEFNRCKSEDVAGIVGLGVDIDLKSDAHPRGARPASIEQALSILPPEFPPSIVVETGNGIQVWWLFKEPWIFKSAPERHQAAALSSRWQTLVGYNAQRNGWAFERLGDLARVLRVPGTQNLKDPANPKNVIIRSLTDHRYNPSDLRDYLDALAILEEDEKVRAAQVQSGGFARNTLVIDLSAVMPDEQLARWMEDPRFRDTWNHNRTGMKDESQSGYDLALANFAVGKGQTDQQIMNLIIQNRRIHGAVQPKSINYYRRTISTARKGMTEEIALTSDAPLTPSFAACPPAAHNASNEGPAARNETDPHARARLCGQLSGLLGIPILRIVKLTGQDPSWVMELDTGCIHFPAVGKFTSQKFVRDQIAAFAGKVMRRFRQAEWDGITQMMLDASIECEGTDDLKLKGFAELQIEQYLNANRVLGSPHLLSPHDLLAPVIDNGRVTISSTHLMGFINKSGTQNFTVKAVAMMIMAVGGEAVRVRRGAKDQSRWALPVAEWNPKEYTGGMGELPNAQ